MKVLLNRTLQLNMTQLPTSGSPILKNCLTTLAESPPNTPETTAAPPGPAIFLTTYTTDTVSFLPPFQFCHQNTSARDRHQFAKARIVQAVASLVQAVASQRCVLMWQKMVKLAAQRSAHQQTMLAKLHQH